ncbi:MAG TPA: DUF4440 domain-containing protein [Steroidobacteraceae bacterium]
MNTRRMIRFARLAALLLATGAARAYDVPVEPEQWDFDEAGIRRSLDASVEAFNRGDLHGHLAIYDEDVNFMTKNGPRPGIAPIEKAFRETYFHEGKPKQQLRFEQLAVHPLTPDVTLATARFVWVRTPAGWRAVHDHSS